LRVNDDGWAIGAMDVLVGGIGQIIGGRQREERLKILDAVWSTAVSTGRPCAPLFLPASGGGLGWGRSAPIRHDAGRRPRLGARLAYVTGLPQRTQRHPVSANPRRRPVLIDGTLRIRFAFSVRRCSVDSGLLCRATLPAS
jgi:hypothetical protein